MGKECGRGSLSKVLPTKIEMPVELQLNKSEDFDTIPGILFTKCFSLFLKIWNVLGEPPLRWAGLKSLACKIVRQHSENRDL